jgi:phosphate transport system substrate-binding protein
MNLRRTAMALLLLLAVATPANASQPLRPATGNTPGVLRIAGNPQLQVLVQRWVARFRRLHPHLRIETRLTGSDTGMAALYTGKADIALLGRSPTASEIQAFQWVFGYRPAQLDVATGSFDQPGRSPALVLFVHRGNPLQQLSLAQLDAIFGAGHRPGTVNIRSWGQLGLTGEWAHRFIHLYMPDATSGSGRFFRHVAMADGAAMNWAHLTEFHDTALTGVGADDAGRKVASALARDRYGLAIASLGDRNDRIRPIAVRENDHATPLQADRNSVFLRQYPFSRSVVACYNPAPGAAANRLAIEFLKFVLGKQGLQQVTPSTGYLPLTAERAAQQRSRLPARSPPDKS